MITMKVNVNKKVIMDLEKTRERNRMYKRKSRAKKKEQMKMHQLKKFQSSAIIQS